jgi:hypothetical protein
MAVWEGLSFLFLFTCQGVHPVSPAIGGGELGTDLLYKAATEGHGGNNGKG